MQRELFGLALFLLFPACAGHAPMPDVFSVDAPGFVPMEPAAGKANLGRQLELKPGVSCFGGKATKPERLRSWADKALKYSGTHPLKDDFGETLKVDREAGSDLSLSVVLHDVYFEEFEDLYIDPHSPCVSDDSLRSRYASPEGRTESVVLKTLKAESIDLNDLRGVDSQVSVNAPVIGGEVKFESKSILKVGGAHLYFAHFPAKIKVTQRSTTCSVTLGTSEATCQLKACSINGLKVTKNGAWTGKLSCPESGASTLTRPLGQWDGKLTSPGATYSVRVTKAPAPGRAKVEMLLWNVHPVE